MNRTHTKAALNKLIKPEANIGAWISTVTAEVKEVKELII